MGKLETGGNKLSPTPPPRLSGRISLWFPLQSQFFVIHYYALCNIKYYTCIHKTLESNDEKSSSSSSTLDSIWTVAETCEISLFNFSVILFVSCSWLFSFENTKKKINKITRNDIHILFFPPSRAPRLKCKYTRRRRGENEETAKSYTMSCDVYHRKYTNVVEKEF